MSNVETDRDLILIFDSKFSEWYSIYGDFRAAQLFIMHAFSLDDSDKTVGYLWEYSFVLE